MEVKNLESYRKILAKHGHDNVSDEELFEISKNIRQLADVVVAYEKIEQRMKSNHQNAI